MLVVCILFGKHLVHACDVCGGGASGQFVGFQPSYKSNFVGIQMLYARLSGSYPSAYIGRPNEQTNDYNFNLRVWGRAHLGHGWHLFTAIPIQYSIRDKDGQRGIASGLGDISLLAYHKLYKSPNARHTIYSGLGCKLPTGVYSSPLTSSNEVSNTVPLGTGSIDAVVNFNYQYEQAKKGILADVTAVYTTQSIDKYRYGSSLQSNIAAFITRKYKLLTLVPNIGARVEYIAMDYYNYPKRYLNEYSGGLLSYATASMQLFYKSFGGRCALLAPINGEYRGGNTQVLFKTECSIFYLF